MCGARQRPGRECSWRPLGGSWQIGSRPGADGFFGLEGLGLGKNLKAAGGTTLSRQKLETTRKNTPKPELLDLPQTFQSPDAMSFRCPKGFIRTVSGRIVQFWFEAFGFRMLFA